MGMKNINPAPHILLDGDGLLSALFGPLNKPSIRWLRYQTKRRTIPHLRIGHFVRYDLAKVREALTQHCTVNARGSQS